MSISVGVTVDCVDPERGARFWVAALGYERQGEPAADARFVSLRRPAGFDGPPQISFQRVAEPKQTKNRVHLDVFVDAAAPVMETMLSAGAALVGVEEAGAWTTRVLTDPVGNEFCLIGPD